MKDEQYMNSQFTKILESLGTQLVTIMEYNNQLLAENLRLMKENAQLEKEKHEIQSKT
jgi:hypothetical protein